MARYGRFGEFLIEKNVITRKDLTRLLAIRQRSREKIGTIVVKEGLLSEEELVGFLSEFLGIPVLNHDVEIIDKEIIDAIPKKMALKAGVIPVGIGEKGELLLACADPVRAALLQNISRLTNRQSKLLLTTPRRLSRMQNFFYTMGYDTSISLSDKAEVESIGFARELLEKLMLRAINKRASDIHIEPERNELVIRLRVDGMLAKAETLPHDLSRKLVSIVKVISGLDIAERRRPQDGAFYFSPQTLDVDIEGVNVRVSVIPTVYGEKAVLRLLPPHDEIIHLDLLGIEPELLKNFKEYLRSPYGIILVTGPTGSGKSTTLYGSMQMLRSETTNITTIEDPVELTIRGITQIQVDAGENITFAKALRSILRQDPDIIMVGEIRDSDTLRISLQAAITGHLVLSTFHTNDAPSAFNRLLDMGAEPFLVAASVRAVLAQRLIRMVCPRCSEWTDITDAELSMIGINDVERFRIRRGKGCDFCDNRGYRGRVGIYELLCVDDVVKRMVTDEANFDKIRDFARKERGFKTLREDGILKVKKGITTPEEIMRVTMN